MPKRTKTVANETRSVRFRIHALVQAGMKEREALLTAMPDDTNRSRKLQYWKDKGIYPVPAEELQKYSSQVPESEEPRTSILPEPTSPQVGGIVGHTRLLVPEEVIDSEVVPVRTSESLESPIESQVAESPPLVATTMQTTSSVLGGLVDSNPEEFTTMLEKLLALHRAGRIPELTEQASPKALPSMPKLSAKPLSIYCNENLRKMAEIKAQNDPNLPAGTNWNRSSLTSYLLWEYLGFPSREEIEDWTEEPA